MSELTHKIPADLIWEDQVGSRYGLDFNPHCPNPALHAQGWPEHTRRYQGLKLMAEHGHDRQVASHVGFQSNLLLYEPGGDFGDSEWGKGTWEYYPIALDFSPSAPNARWRVFAVARSSKIDVPFKLDGRRVRFDWKRNLGGREIERYRVEKRDAPRPASKTSQKRSR